MHIRNILTILFIFSSLSIFANIDSTGVQNNKGKKLIIHKVEAKETYYSLGRKYGVDPKTIMDFNDNIPLQIGTVLNIPTDRPFIAENTPQKNRNTPQKNRNTPQKNRNAPQKNTVNTNPTFLRYKVHPKETLSGIAERYNTSVKTIQELNNMKGTNLRIGQVLKIRQSAAAEPKQEAPVPVQRTEVTSTATNTTAEEEKGNNDAKNETVPKIDASRYGLKEHTEHGVAIWIDDDNVDGTRLLVLHRTAPIGTVIKITNPMTDKSTFAKVVGKFTENESTKDALIVLTKAVADLIGALDKRFQVTIDYGLNE